MDGNQPRYEHGCLFSSEGGTALIDVAVNFLGGVALGVAVAILFVLWFMLRRNSKK